MLGLTYEEILKIIQNKTNLPKQNIENKIKNKLEQLSDLISKQGAAHIIANELGINLFDKQLKENVSKLKVFFSKQLKQEFEELLDKSKEIQEIIDKYNYNLEAEKFKEEINKKILRKILMYSLFYGKEEPDRKKIYKEKIQKLKNISKQPQKLLEINKTLRNKILVFFESFIRGNLDQEKFQKDFYTYIQESNKCILDGLNFLILRKINQNEFLIRKGRFKLATMKDIEKNLDDIKKRKESINNLDFIKKKEKFQKILIDLGENIEDGIRSIKDSKWTMRLMFGGLILAIIAIVITLWSNILKLVEIIKGWIL